ncbi:SDR family NAD(P)-dependent oxidoreductase [Pseudonocardia halophobica]|uniref:SDR family NAD(P)-dependent oxidoreductase n=1 Tax=Pseudonocardia halophobica TaxID=29401 RepID=UPI003D8B9128
MELVSTTAIVTGGSKGIGYGVADLLMSHGANVVISSRKQHEVEAAARTLTEAHTADGTRAVGVAGDVGSSADVARLFATAVEEFGPVGIVVNNAGNSTLDLITDLPEEDFDSVIRTHLKGTFLGTKAALNHMKETGTRGAIVNIGSVETFATTRGNAHYSAAKAGIDKLTEVAALEGGRLGIRVNTVGPGAVQTPMGEEVSTPEFTAAWLRSFSVDRYGRPDDIAKAVVFLASDYAEWITGINLLVDGGTHLCGLPDYADHLLPNAG